MARWTCIHKDKGGHRLFIDTDLPVEGTDVPRVFIADQSGSTPDQTDDGVLEIDYEALIKTDRITLAPSHGHLIADVPVLKYAAGRERYCSCSGAETGCEHADWCDYFAYTVGLSAGCAVHYARLTEIPLLVSDPTLREPLRLDATE